MVNSQTVMLPIDLDDEPDHFIHPGFNSHILNIGPAWQFWECYQCGNATASLPVKCEKCQSINSFLFRGYGREDGDNETRRLY